MGVKKGWRVYIYAVGKSSFYGIWHSENPSEVSPCRSNHLYLEELLDKFPVDNGALDILSWAWMGIVRYSSSDSRRARCVLCTVCLQ